MFFKGFLLIFLLGMNATYVQVLNIKFIKRRKKKKGRKESTALENAFPVLKQCKTKTKVTLFKVYCLL